MAGKKSGGSESIYKEKINRHVNNKVLDNPRAHCPEKEKDRKVPAFYLRYFATKLKKIHITTDPLMIDDEHTRRRFLAFVRRYEENNKIRLLDASKNELLYAFLDYVEATDSIISLNDDSEQFVPYRFQFPDVMKLYFYKMFYPGIFDFDVVQGENGETIKFRSEYLEENFPEIYKSINFMFLAILYDALIIAIENSSFKQIESMKSYDVTINPEDAVSSLKEYLEDMFKINEKIKASKDKKKKGKKKKGKKKEKNKEPREKILEMFIPSIIFFSKHHHVMYKKRNIKKILITSALKFGAFYEGSRADESRQALCGASEKCCEILNQKPYTFNRLLNLYHINRKTNLLDLQIIKDNVDFRPYLFDGIIIKYLINDMISDNSKKLKKSHAKGVDLFSVHNNPNCIVDNLSSRDYEMLDFIISRTAKTMQTYYLKKGKKDVPPSRIYDFADWIGQDHYTQKILNVVPEFETISVDNVDYEDVMQFRKMGVGMEG